MTISNFQRVLDAGSAAGQANGLVTARLDVEVNAGSVALLWSVTPRAGATIRTLSALLGTTANGILQGQFCGAEYPLSGNGGATLAGTLSGTAACFVPTPTLETVAIFAGQVDGPGGGMFFFTQPFTL